MKKLLLVLLSLGVIGTTLYTFRTPLKEALFARITADMFVAQDTDDFDPGIQVGEMFPAILARYQNTEVKSLEAFMGEKGLAVFFVRSVDW